jgi:hypothetical protein
VSHRACDDDAHHGERDEQQARRRAGDRLQRDGHHEAVALRGEKRKRREAERGKGFA